MREGFVVLAWNMDTPGQNGVGGDTPAWPPIDGEAASEVLDLLNVGLVLVSATAQVLAVNKPAAGYLRVGDGLGVEGGRLMAETTAETAYIRQCIKDAADSGIPGALLIRRSRDARPHTVIVQATGAGEHRRVLVAVRESGQKSEAFVGRVRGMFRLAPAEADIAVQLATGSDLPEIAAARGVTINTVRTQIASAMIKVGVRRQAELVAAIAGLDILI